MPQIRHRRWPLALLGLVALAGLALAACSEGATGGVLSVDGTRQISVAGRGEASADPDTVILSLGVSVLRDTVTEAIADAADLMTEVIQVLRDQGVEEDDIQTTNFAVFPEFDFSRDNERELRGFRVSNQVSASLRDVGAAGALIDAAAQAGGDDVLINDISFTIDDSQALLDEARELAVADARRKAEQIARLTGVDLGDVIAISESSRRAPAPQIFARITLDAAAEFAATPVAPGQSSVSVSVTIVYELK